MDHISKHLPALPAEAGKENTPPPHSWQSLAEIQAKNLKIGSEPPNPENCPFCKANLEPEAIAGGIFGTATPIIGWRIHPCECEEAAAKREADAAEFKAKQKAEAEAERKRIMSMRTKELQGQSGIGRRFLDGTLANFKHDAKSKPAYQAAVSFVRNWEKCKQDGKGVYFMGSIGAGKTHLATGIANALIAEGVPVICKTGGEILNDIRKTFNDGNLQTEAAVTDLYKTVDLLIIDDLGKESATEWVISTLYGIVNERYERMLPTIVTTNYKDDQLIHRLSRGGDTTTGEAIVSRLHEQCFGVEMWLDDYRLK